MKTQRLAVLAAIVALSAGCHRTVELQPMSISEVGSAVKKCFAQADAAVRAEAEAAATDVANKDYPNAFAKVLSLSSMRGLAAEQRATLMRAQLALNQTLSTAAASGDAQSVEALHQYMSTK